MKLRITVKSQNTFVHDRTKRNLNIENHYPWAYEILCRSQKMFKFHIINSQLAKWSVRFS